MYLTAAVGLFVLYSTLFPKTCTSFQSNAYTSQISWNFGYKSFIFNLLCGYLYHQIFFNTLTHVLTFPIDMMIWPLYFQYYFGNWMVYLISLLCIYQCIGYATNNTWLKEQDDWKKKRRFNREQQWLKDELDRIEEEKLKEKEKENKKKNNNHKKENSSDGDHESDSNNDVANDTTKDGNDNDDSSDTDSSDSDIDLNDDYHIHLTERDIKVKNRKDSIAVTLQNSNTVFYIPKSLIEKREGKHVLQNILKGIEPNKENENEQPRLIIEEDVFKLIMEWFLYGEIFTLNEITNATRNSQPLKKQRDKLLQIAEELDMHELRFYLEIRRYTTYTAMFQLLLTLSTFILFYHILPYLYIKPYLEELSNEYAFYLNVILIVNSMIRTLGHAFDYKPPIMFDMRDRGFDLLGKAYEGLQLNWIIFIPLGITSELVAGFPGRLFSFFVIICTRYTLQCFGNITQYGLWVIDSWKEIDDPFYSVITKNWHSYWLSAPLFKYWIAEDDVEDMKTIIEEKKKQINNKREKKIGKLFRKLDNTTNIRSGSRSAGSVGVKDSIFEEQISPLTPVKMNSFTKFVNSPSNSTLIKSIMKNNYTGSLKSPLNGNTGSLKSPLSATSPLTSPFSPVTATSTANISESFNNLLDETFDEKKQKERWYFRLRNAVSGYIVEKTPLMYLVTFTFVFGLIACYYLSIYTTLPKEGLMNALFNI